MTVCVYGLWHLGSVTAACMAATEPAGHTVIGLDPDAGVVARLAEGAPPLFEPGLEDLLRRGLDAGRLRFTNDIGAASDAAVVWVTFDTPVDDDDRADVESVVEAVIRLFPHLRDGALVILSSQLPVGTTARLERLFAEQARGRVVDFACLPENLRLGKAIEVFTQPDRVVAGVRSAGARATIAALLAPLTRIEWMGVESAEMTKHALNAFLATSVTFINEVAAICEQVGADAAEVARGLKTDARIGARAYLSPGGAFAGGTLARDIGFLSELGRTHGVPTDLIAAVRSSNDAHRRWPARRLASLLGPVSGRTIAVWGLTYKPGTDTLRRSSAIELCEWLASHGALVRAHDPVIKDLGSRFPPKRQPEFAENDSRGLLLTSVTLVDDPLAAVDGADALVVATPWPVYREVAAADVGRRMPSGHVLDANGFLVETLGREPGLRYSRVGQAATS